MNPIPDDRLVADPFPRPSQYRSDWNRIESVDNFDVRRYLTNMRTSLSSKGQIVLPAEMREQDCFAPVNSSKWNGSNPVNTD